MWDVRELIMALIPLEFEWIIMGSMQIFAVIADKTWQIYIKMAILSAWSKLKIYNI